jgi:hypothetical protein
METTIDGFAPHVARTKEIININQKRNNRANPLICTVFGGKADDKRDLCTVATLQNVVPLPSWRQNELLSKFANPCS